MFVVASCAPFTDRNQPLISVLNIFHFDFFLPAEQLLGFIGPVLCPVPGRTGWSGFNYLCPRTCLLNFLLPPLFLTRHDGILKHEFILMCVRLFSSLPLYMQKNQYFYLHV
ncbi:hypothetical protein QL285_043061 [Trifolium repens]|nr:hypothetical protein QL285_043061 [Trifolium repens]